MDDRANDLLRDVDLAFAITGAETPGWPDPHPDLAAPTEEEYSRCLDPGKYRILDARLAAWVRVLTERGVAIADAVPAQEWAGAKRPIDQISRVLRLRPRGTGRPVLLFATTIVDGEEFGIDVAVDADATRPPIVIGTVPVCGCDACDDGSAALLEELDDYLVERLL